ncbi:MAG: class I SAM-dependent methyltransferase [Candidatus Scalindua sp.]|nr:class I SAM-dependent methyltransferase [Candidatus Scalindua sp.]
MGEIHQQNYYKTSKEYLEVISAGHSETYNFYCDLIEKVTDKKYKILDIGCGTGTSTQIINSRFGNVVGVDVSHMFMNKTKAKDASLTFVAARAESVPFKDTSFDIVASNSFIEHVPDVEAVMRELVRITKQDGFLVFHGPNLISPITPLIKAFRKIIGQKTSPIFGMTIIGCFLQSLKNIQRIKQRKISEECLIEYREPDLSFHGDDSDATWFSNPQDIENILKKHGVRVVLCGCEHNWFRNFIVRRFPNVLGLSIIAQKVIR